MLAGLPPAVERAVREPTFALRLNCRTGTLAASMLSETVERLVAKHGLINTAEFLGLSHRRMKAILEGTTSVTFRVAGQILTFAGEAIRWHTDPELRRAYWSYADVPLCLVNGHRPPADWKRRSKRGARRGLDAVECVLRLVEGATGAPQRGAGLRDRVALLGLLLLLLRELLLLPAGRRRGRDTRALRLGHLAPPSVRGCACRASRHPPCRWSGLSSGRTRLRLGFVTFSSCRWFVLDSTYVSHWLRATSSKVSGSVWTMRLMPDMIARERAQVQPQTNGKRVAVRLWYVGWANALAEALLDGLPGPALGLGDLRPHNALRTGLLDRSSLKLWQDVSDLRKRFEDHERLIA